MKYYFEAFKNYANSEGRATRKEYWFFVLFHSIIVSALMVFDMIFSLYPETLPTNYGYTTLAYLLATALPSVCLRIRRLHDVGKSGFWFLAGSVPVLSFYVLYLYIRAGDSGRNAYGFPPNTGLSEKEETEPYKSRFTECPKCGYIAVFEKKCPRCDYELPTEVQADESSEKKPLFCGNCGTKLLEGARFCKECGAEIIEKVEKKTDDSQ